MRRLGRQIAWAIGTAGCAGILVGVIVSWVFAARGQTETECRRLLTIASSVARQCDAASLAGISPGSPPPLSETHAKVVTLLGQSVEMNPGIRRALVAVPDGRGWHCVAAFGKRSPGDSGSELAASSVFSAEEIPEPALAAMVGSWGVFTRAGRRVAAAYAPVKDDDGKAVALVGVESWPEPFVLPLSAVAVLVAAAGGLFLSGAAAARWLCASVAEPVGVLLERARQVKPGSVSFEEVKSGVEEIDELGRVFGRMVKTLENSQKVFHGYFSRAMHTLARLVESKDVYMKGHSQRVGMYAEKIALAMGLPAEKAALMREMGELHDIGKLVIDERILNKAELLTEEEWQVVRRHPLMSEEILRPVILNRELLEIVRHHHERYDGKGYPDGLAGNRVPVLSQVLAAADAYDAMTSKRSYRKNFTQKEAMEELKRNSGSQFNPTVVEAFLKVLTEEFRS